MSAPLEIVNQWVEKAEHDLRNAEHTLTLQEDCPFDTVCYHAQQCAEKYLKAFLISKSLGLAEKIGAGRSTGYKYTGG